MIDFLTIGSKPVKGGGLEVYPKFIIKKSTDLMIRGGDFYAIWIEERGLWSTDELEALQLIDRELDRHAEETRQKLGIEVKVLYMWDSENGMITRWHNYVQKHMRDNYHMLDDKLVWSNTPTTKKDYVSKRLSYPLERGDITAWDRLISTLYNQSEREKLEWAIGAIVSGDSRTIQKFLVLYGAQGTGKSTILNVVQQLFHGYYSVFDAKALGSTSQVFALEAFRNNPLVAIQHDGDLSKIEDNTRLNSLVSHELMTVNEKYTKGYEARFKCFLFMGTNKPVKITDGKSGLLRRLIDVSPSGNKIPGKEYKTLIKQVEFELGAIATHCYDFYMANKSKYDGYVPISMMSASNDFHNFMEDSYSVFYNEDGTTLNAAWEMYKNYCSDANVPYPYSKRVFKEELKNYFYEFKDREKTELGSKMANIYTGFRKDKFDFYLETVENTEKEDKPMSIEHTVSLFDNVCAEYKAQYAKADGTPKEAWDNVTTKLSDIDTSRLHYVLFPDDRKNHIVIDFDIKDENGNKNPEKNLEAASTWPPTYAEFSKSGGGVHLHYIYTGDVSLLDSVYDEHIEIKVFSGKQALRRKLTKCNDLPIATLGSGLPLKGVTNSIMIDKREVRSELSLKRLIEENINKKHHAYTKPSIDFINKILNDAYNSDLKYDLTSMKNVVYAFAAQSSNNSDYCIKVVNNMKFKSDDEAAKLDYDPSSEMVFYDVEVFPNLFLVNWKIAGEGRSIVRMINPKPSEIDRLINHKLVGFNCRKYDNHMLYARLMGYTTEQIFELSQKIIVDNDRNAYFGSAYNISYTDIYDYCSKKQSLKKWEIELGISHKELGLPWDKPVPEELWEKVAEYCDNDVIATEAVFNATQGDFIAREVLADVAGSTVNDTTNSLTGKIIFGVNRNPQTEFNYRDMGMVSSDDYVELGFDDYTRFNEKGQPVFPSYEFEAGTSTYRGEIVGEGGYVYSEPGMYGNVALLDIASMHPSSIIAEILFGDKYTRRFKEIVLARLYIKRKQIDKAKKMLGGALAKYLKDEKSIKQLAFALKIAINSVYGLTSARFPNKFKDPRNIDNIVAKRGALFMINLKHEVQKRGFIVAHIKTDSIKIPDATPEIIKFVSDYGKLYGYDFEHEATYDRMCLVNDAVYIAKYKDASECEELYGYAPEENKKSGNEWTATGKQFAVPYLFKTLFSKEPIEFKDMCETKQVKGAMYLDMNEGLGPDEHNYVFVGKVGQFTPIRPGFGTGELLCEQRGGMNAVTGTKGYRWLESEMVQNLGLENQIDYSYYDKMVEEAANDIASFGDYNWFVSDRPYVGPPLKDGVPVYLDGVKNNA